MKKTLKSIGILTAVAMIFGLFATGCTVNFNVNSNENTKTENAGKTDPSAPTSAEKEAEPIQSATELKPQLPTDRPVDGDYKTFENDYVSFEYCSDWYELSTEYNGYDLIMLTENADGTGSNINLVTEAYSPIYATMDKDMFAQLYGDTLVNSGITIDESSILIKNVQNPNGLDVTVLSYRASLSGIEYGQYQYIFKNGVLNVLVTVTEYNDFNGLETHVFNTLNIP